jgi:cobalt/nickel transport system ATP-binding protein
MGGTVDILALENVVYSYPGRTEHALDHASVRLPARRKIAFLGRNGSGKSTLFLHCNGILTPSSGVVRFMGEPITYDRRSLIDLRRRVGIVFQNADDQLFSASVAQDISFGPLNLGMTDDEARERVHYAANLCNITDLLDRPTHALSGGQKTRVALAGVLAMDPDVLLADETTASLDPWMRRQVFDILRRLTAQGKTILLATHHIQVARRWADLVTVMDEGRVIAFDEPERVFGDAPLMEKTGLDKEWIL